MITTQLNADALRSSLRRAEVDATFGASQRMTSKSPVRDDPHPALLLALTLNLDGGLGWMDALSALSGSTVVGTYVRT
jgi:hypothetical protein